MKSYITHVNIKCIIPIVFSMLFTWLLIVLAYLFTILHFLDGLLYQTLSITRFVYSIVLYSFRYTFYKIIYLYNSLKLLEYNKYLSPGF